MIELGRTQTLRIVNIVEFGLYLDAGTDDYTDNVLLPKNQFARDEFLEGDQIEVFIYRDSEDRIIATRKKPFAQVGELAYLEVTSKTPIGAFLDWGLGKDLFLPFREQHYDIEVGDKYLVKVYVDHSDRLCATTSIYSALFSDSEYQKNDFVEGIAYEVRADVGVLVAIDNQYYGLIPENEYFNKIKEGEKLTLRVIRVREDGRLDVTPRKLVQEQIGEDAEMILEKLKEKGGQMSIHDKSDPRDIKKELGMSKKAFKRAVGGLLKAGTIEKIENGLKLK